jgi:4-azaleucine resistance transporter AzlC
LPPVDQPTYVRDGLIIGFTTGLFGAGFGVLAISSGLTTAQACVMSLLVFTGASQFAAVGVIGAGGSPISAAGSALLLAARNGLYGMTVSEFITGSRVKRTVAAQLTIDESTALAIGQKDPAYREPAFWAGGLSVFLFWNLGTLAGAMGGSALGDPANLGLDAAFPAAFVALIMPSLRHRPGLLAAVSGATIAAIAVPFSEPGLPILLASFGAVLALAIAGSPPEPVAAEDQIA